MLKYSYRLDRMFHALADSGRRAMVERLVRSPASVSELARPFDMSLPAVVQHLKVLEDAGIVTSEKVGRIRTYQLAPDALTVCGEWIGGQHLPAERRLDRLGELLDNTNDNTQRRSDMNSTSEHTQTHATFVLEREYSAPVERVWAAFADPEVKSQWFANDEFSDLEVVEDFRIGGTIVNNGTDSDGHRSEFRAIYTDIVDQERIVYAYDMWLDGTHASTSITTVTFQPGGAGTRLTFTEQGVHLDGVHGPGPEAAAGREHGTGWMLDRIAEVLGIAITESA